MAAASFVAPLPPLRRHQLVRLAPDGWAHVLAAPWDAALRPCLALWAARALPLVVTSQSTSAIEAIAAGLPAPLQWQRRRLPLAVSPRHVLRLDTFPDAQAVTRLLPPGSRVEWRALLATLAEAGCWPCAYGGYGWQALTRLAYVHAGSDLDLLLPVTTPAQADAVVRALSTAPWNGPRLDGELLFADGAAVAWREWAAYRAGRVAQVLVKRLRGAALETPRAEAA